MESPMLQMYVLAQRLTHYCTDEAVNKRVTEIMADTGSTNDVAEKLSQFVDELEATTPLTAAKYALLVNSVKYHLSNCLVLGQYITIPQLAEKIKRGVAVTEQMLCDMIRNKLDPSFHRLYFWLFVDHTTPGSTTPPASLVHALVDATTEDQADLIKIAETYRETGIRELNAARHLSLCNAGFTQGNPTAFTEEQVNIFV